MKHKNHNTKKHYLNENIFNIIDTEEKAYWLGFLYADGCVSSNCNKISLNLSEKDREHLEKFKQFLDYRGKIRVAPAKTSVIRGKLINSSPMNILSFSSKQMKQDLILLGCVPRKSLILKFPTNDQVPNSLMSHFVRGYFDGDGWFCRGKTKYKTNRKNYSIGFISSLDFLEGLKSFIFKSMNINMSIRASGIVYTLTSGGNANCYKLSNFLYKNSKIFLIRKYEIFNEIQNVGICIMSGKNSHLASHFKVKKTNGEIIEINNVQIFCKENPQYNKTSLSFLKRGLQKTHKDLTLL